MLVSTQPMFMAWRRDQTWLYNSAFVPILGVKLTQRLLALSRRQTLDPRAIDVNILIAGMAHLIRRSVGPNITVEVVGAGC
jgi:hypothetical protein